MEVIQLSPRPPPPAQAKERVSVRRSRGLLLLLSAFRLCIFLALICLGFWTRFHAWNQLRSILEQSGSLQAAEKTQLYAIGSASPWLIIGVGLLGTLSQVFGLGGALIHRKWLLISFLSLDWLIIALTFVAAVISGVGAREMRKEDSKTSNTVSSAILQLLYAKSRAGQLESIESVMDDLQTALKCCGLRGPGDWWSNSSIQFQYQGKALSISIPSGWIALCYEETQSLCYTPQSCCKSRSNSQCHLANNTLSEVMMRTFGFIPPSDTMDETRWRLLVKANADYVEPSYPSKMQSRGCPDVLRSHIASYLVHFSVIAFILFFLSLIAYAAALFLCRKHSSPTSPSTIFVQ